MATTSITKNFVIYDQENYLKLKKELDSRPARTVRTSENSSLKRGKEKLAQLSCR